MWNSRHQLEPPLQLLSACRGGDVKLFACLLGGEKEKEKREYRKRAGKDNDTSFVRQRRRHMIGGHSSLTRSFDVVFCGVNPNFF